MDLDLSFDYVSRLEMSRRSGALPTLVTAPPPARPPVSSTARPALRSASSPLRSDVRGMSAASGSRKPPPAPLTLRTNTQSKPVSAAPPRQVLSKAGGKQAIRPDQSFFSPDSAVFSPNVAEEEEPLPITPLSATRRGQSVRTPLGGPGSGSGAGPRVAVQQRTISEEELLPLTPLSTTRRGQSIREPSPLGPHAALPPSPAAAPAPPHSAPALDPTRLSVAQSARSSPYRPNSEVELPPDLYALVTRHMPAPVAVPGPAPSASRAQELGRNISSHIARERGSTASTSAPAPRSRSSLHRARSTDSDWKTLARLARLDSVASSISEYSTTSEVDARRFVREEEQVDRDEGEMVVLRRNSAGTVIEYAMRSTSSAGSGSGSAHGSGDQPRAASRSRSEARPGTASTTRHSGDSFATARSDADAYAGADVHGLARAASGAGSDAHARTDTESGHSGHSGHSGAVGAGAGAGAGAERAQMSYSFGGSFHTGREEGSAVPVQAEWEGNVLGLQFDEDEEEEGERLPYESRDSHQADNLAFERSHSSTSRRGYPFPSTSTSASASGSSSTAYAHAYGPSRSVRMVADPSQSSSYTFTRTSSSLMGRSPTSMTTATTAHDSSSTPITPFSPIFSDPGTARTGVSGTSAAGGSASSVEGFGTPALSFAALAEEEGMGKGRAYGTWSGTGKGSGTGNARMIRASAQVLDLGKGRERMPADKRITQEWIRHQSASLSHNQVQARGRAQEGGEQELDREREEEQSDVPDEDAGQGPVILSTESSPTDEQFKFSPRTRPRGPSNPSNGTNGTSATTGTNGTNGTGSGTRRASGALGLGLGPWPESPLLLSPPLPAPDKNVNETRAQSEDAETLVGEEEPEDDEERERERQRKRVNEGGRGEMAGVGLGVGLGLGLGIGEGMEMGFMSGSGSRPAASAFASASASASACATGLRKAKSAYEMRESFARERGHCEIEMPLLAEEARGLGLGPAGSELVVGHVAVPHFAHGGALGLDLGLPAHTDTEDKNATDGGGAKGRFSIRVPPGPLSAPLPVMPSSVSATSSLDGFAINVTPVGAARQLGSLEGESGAGAGGPASGSNPANAKGSGTGNGTGSGSIGRWSSKIWSVASGSAFGFAVPSASAAGGRAVEDFSGTSTTASTDRKNGGVGAPMRALTLVSKKNREARREKRRASHGTELELESERQDFRARAGGEGMQVEAERDAQGLSTSAPATAPMPPVAVFRSPDPGRSRSPDVSSGLGFDVDDPRIRNSAVGRALNGGQRTSRTGHARSPKLQYLFDRSDVRLDIRDEAGPGSGAAPSRPSLVRSSAPPARSAAAAVPHTEDVPPALDVRSPRVAESPSGWTPRLTFDSNVISRYTWGVVPGISLRQSTPVLAQGSGSGSPRPNSAPLLNGGGEALATAPTAGMEGMPTPPLPAAARWSAGAGAQESAAPLGYDDGELQASRDRLRLLTSQTMPGATLPHQYFSDDAGQSALRRRSTLARPAHHPAGAAAHFSWASGAKDSAATKLGNGSRMATVRIEEQDEVLEKRGERERERERELERTSRPMSIFVPTSAIQSHLLRTATIQEGRAAAMRPRRFSRQSALLIAPGSVLESAKPSRTLFWAGFLGMPWLWLLGGWWLGEDGSIITHSNERVQFWQHEQSMVDALNSSPSAPSFRAPSRVPTAETSPQMHTPTLDRSPTLVEQVSRGGASSTLASALGSSSESSGSLLATSPERIPGANRRSLAGLLQPAPLVALFASPVRSAPSTPTNGGGRPSPSEGDLSTLSVRELAQMSPPGALSTRRTSHAVAIPPRANTSANTAVRAPRTNMVQEWKKLDTYVLFNRVAALVSSTLIAAAVAAALFVVAYSF